MIHDQDIANDETRLAAELGVNDWLALGATLPYRFFKTSIRYLDPSGAAVDIENPTLHHRNETLTGPGDPWLYARAATVISSVRVGGRAGATIPLGRTEPDPFVLGDMGIPHEHSQFGTGTFGLIAGVEASTVIGGVHVDANLFTIQTTYANGHGYEAGDRYAAAVGAASALGATHWRFRATLQATHETAETWGGIVHTDDGNVGRTDVLAGLEATWLVTDDWHVGVSVLAPVYTHIAGGQLDVLGFVGLTVGTHFHVFAPHRAHADWTGLDERDATTVAPVPGKVTVYDFWATWCAPCRIVDRELAAIARRHPNDLAVRKIDIEDVDSPAAAEYLRGATLPHVKLFGRDGALVWERSAPPLALAAAVEEAITGPHAKRAIDPTAKRIAIDVTDDGYVPARIEIERDHPVTLVVTRKSNATCATDVHIVLPDGSRIDEQLPFGQPVEIALPPESAGEFTYACGMNMFHGTIVVK